MLEVVEFCTWLAGIWIIVVTGFSFWEKTITDSERRWVNKAISLPAKIVLTDLPNLCTALFDRVFGVGHFSRRCFGVSVALSCGAVVTLSVVWILIRPIEGVLYISYAAAAPMRESVALIMVFCSLNAVVDFVSLFETRIMLKMMGRSRSLPVQALLLLADIVISWMIFMISLTLIVIFMTYLILGDDGMRQELLYRVIVEGFLRGQVELFTLRAGDALFPMGVFLYTTFFTTFWAILLSAAVFVDRFFVPLRRVEQRILNSDKPVMRLGVEIATILVAVVAVIGLVDFVL